RQHARRGDEGRLRPPPEGRGRGLQVPERRPEGRVRGSGGGQGPGGDERVADRELSWPVKKRRSSSKARSSRRFGTACSGSRSTTGTRRWATPPARCAGTGSGSSPATGSGS